MKPAFPTLTLVLGLLLGVPAAEAQSVDTNGDEAVACPAPLSYVGLAVDAALAAYGPRGRSELTSCNEIAPGWFTYYEPETAIPGYYGHVASLMPATKSQFQVSMLNAGADVQWALAVGIRALHDQGSASDDVRRPLVRIITGNESAASVYAGVTQLLPTNAPWNVQVLVIKIGQIFLDDWNHSKMAIRDGCLALSGSVEVADKGEAVMQLRGEAAAAAKRFYESVQSTYVWHHPPFGDCAASDPSFCAETCIRDRCWESTSPTLPACAIWSGIGRPVFSLGRGIFRILLETDKSADAAVFAAIESANDEIVLLQRSLELKESAPKYVPRLYRALAEAAARGVEVRIMIGEEDILNPPPEDVMVALADVMEEVFDEQGLPTAALREARRRVRIRQVPTHAKVFVVDRQAVYVGSENLYPSGLQDGHVVPLFELYEQGFLVDDAGLASEVAERLETLWAEGGSTLYSPWAFDGVYDVHLSASGSGTPGTGQCAADFTLELVHGEIQPPGDFLCYGTFNGDPIVVDGWVDGSFDITGDGEGRLFGEVPPFADLTTWTGAAVLDQLAGVFSDLHLGIVYSGSFTGAIQP